MRTVAMRLGHMGIVNRWVALAIMCGVGAALICYAKHPVLGPGSAKLSYLLPTYLLAIAIVFVMS